MREITADAQQLMMQSVETAGLYIHKAIAILDSTRREFDIADAIELSKVMAGDYQKSMELKIKESFYQRFIEEMQHGKVELSVLDDLN